MKIVNIFIKTIYEKRRFVFFWCIGIMALSLLYATVYNSINNNASLTKALESTSSGIKSLIGSADFFSTPAGFIHAELFSITMPMILGVTAILLGSSILNKEEETRTIELLLARPVSRHKIINQKFFGLMSIIFLLALSIVLGLWFGRLSVDVFNLDMFITSVATFELMLIALAFGSIALTLSAFRPNRGFAGGVTGAIFTLSYVISTFGNQIQWLRHFRYISLFHYYDTVNILQHKFNIMNFVILVLVIFICLGLSNILIYRRDI